MGITELPRGEAEGEGEEPDWGGATEGSSAMVGLDLAGRNWKVTP